jgi:hypothetical protein
MLLRTAQAVQPRRGVILLVVLALLTLFAIVGISFVLYADSEATSARVYREAQSLTRPDMDPQLALALVLGQIIYDVPDDETGVYSALRGHSLARLMYGYYYDDPTPALGWSPSDDRAFCGTGRLRETGLPAPFNAAPDSTQLVNFTYFASAGDPLRDPERLGTRPSLAGGLAGRGKYTGGANVPYTYPDHQNMFLAMVRASDNRVLVPSYHRPWVFGSLADSNNPNWTNQVGKYLILRPRPADMGPGFPLPEDEGGDVKNLDFAPGGNDSIWIDVNAPVLTAADGRKYKMLVAPLIVDLDGRINLNTAGNVLGTNNAHAGTQGWGPWEVDLSKVLSLSPNEWQNVLLGTPQTGRPTTSGRYGFNRANFNRFPAGAAVPAFSRVHPYAPIDYNGVIDPGKPGAGNPTPALSLPGGANTKHFQVFPYFSPDGYNNGAPFETTTTGTAAGTPNHPSIYNAARPVPENRSLLPQGMVALLRPNSTGSEALSSELLRLCPTNFANTKARNLVTTTSWDIDRPAVLPYVWNRESATVGERYRLDNTNADLTLRFPTGNALPFPALAQRNATPAQSEFDPATWRSLNAALPRLDLSRKLTDYPAPVNGTITNLTQYGQAVRDRQAFAKDIFDTLRGVTGALDPARASVAPYGTTSPEFQALRWLAQLAVNIVDYIDNDDYITPFNWFSNQWVYGTELPRLVLNEAYAQRDNDPTDPGLAGTTPADRRATRYTVNCWVELHNPFPAESTAQHPDGGSAKLQIGTRPVYQLVLTKPNTGLRNPENVLGTPDTAPATTLSTVNSWGTQAFQQEVKPGFQVYRDTAQQNNGFYVLGPPATAFLSQTDPQFNASPNLPTTSTSPQMSYRLLPTDPVVPPTILLQRLACPHLAAQPSPALANYNPYVTVDYVEGVQVWDGRLYTDTSANNPFTPMAQRRTEGRTQPFAGAQAQRWPQAPQVAKTNSPQHTFFRHNAVEEDAPVQAATAGQTLKVSFNWLVHLDRQPSSPMELLHVSAFKPHELTQQFVTGGAAPANFGTAQQHLARWTQNDTRLARFFEFVTVGPRARGVGLDWRAPGRVNINSIWDVETFRALCNRQLGNAFSDADVDDVFNALVAQRSPTPDGATGRKPGPNDKPFWGLATGFAAASPTDPLSATARGVESTLLRPDPSTTAWNGLRLLEPRKDGTTREFTHPYRRYEMLTKLFNNLTTRSNVFAVWLTVGFFEVTDDSTRPVKLGAEIGRAENRLVRHRMFALVDRTNLWAFSGMLSFNLSAGVKQYVTFIDHPDTTRTGRTWRYRVGSVEVMEANTDNEETLVIQQDALGAYLLSVKTHLINSTTLSPGNPGPWKRYDPRLDGAVVPYFAVID